MHALESRKGSQSVKLSRFFPLTAVFLPGFAVSVRAMMTLIAIAVLCLSGILMASSLRMVARDTFDTLADAAARARSSGRLMQRSAFAMLWVMIFALSYL